MDENNKTSQDNEQNKNTAPAEKPVDQKVQEEAAEERKDTGGYQ